jgi:hypothetical protein
MGMDINGRKCGGIVSFYDKIRQALSLRRFDKAVIVWSGLYDGSHKYDQFPSLKAIKQEVWKERSFILMMHSGSVLSKKQQNEWDVLSQKSEVQDYISKFFPIRQLMDENMECHDMIASYCKKAVPIGENIFILSRDGMFDQLVSEYVSTISFDMSILHKDNVSKVKLYHPTNELMVRCILGMAGTICDGMDNMSEKKLVHYFPMLTKEHCSFNELIDHARKESETKKFKTYESFLGFIPNVKRNAKMINFSDPYATVGSIKLIMNSICSTLPDYQLSNNFKEFQELDFFHLLHPNDDSFFEPFYQILAKEEEYSLFCI